MLSADNFCKQFGPSSGPTECQAFSGHKLFYTLLVFRKDFFEKVDFEKISRQQKSVQNFPDNYVIESMLQIEFCAH